MTQLFQKATELGMTERWQKEKNYDHDYLNSRPV